MGKTTRRMRAADLYAELAAQLDQFADWTEEQRIATLRTVQGFHLKYLMEATREGLNTGVLASMSIIERIQKVFKDMGLNGTDTIDQLRDDVAACRLVLGQAIDFAKMADQVAAQRPNVN